MLSLLKRPPVHFFIAGALLFAATRWIEPSATVLGADDPHLIVVEAGQVEDLRAKERLRSGASPTAAEVEALIEAFGVDEMLYREALARGLDDEDAVVQRRLVQDMRFLSDDPGIGDAALLQQAQALGLQSSDPVIRRRLVQKMRFVLTAERDGVDPTEDELREFFEKHRDAFAPPPRVRMSHLFFSGSQAWDHASNALAALTAAGGGAQAVSEYGEPFLAGSVLPSLSERGLAKLFGDQLAHVSMSLPIERWSGPVRSAHGVHLIWIHERNAPAASVYEHVRDRVRQRFEAECDAAQLDARIAQLRTRYRLEIRAPQS